MNHHKWCGALGGFPCTCKEIEAREQHKQQIDILQGVIRWQEELILTMRANLQRLTDAIEEHRDCDPEAEPCYASDHLVEVLDDIRKRQVEAAS